MPHRLSGLMLMLLLAVVVSAGSAGCAVPPPMQLPESTVELPPDGFVADRARLTGTVDAEWWKGFGDAGLVELVAAVVAHNPSLMEAAERVEAAAMQAKIAGASLYPSASLGVTAGRAKSVFGATTTEATSLGVSLSVSWEADVWGKVRTAQGAALADWQAAQSDRRAATLSLIAAAAHAWFAAVEARLQRDLAKETVESYRTTVNVTSQRFDQGVRGALDVRTVRAQLAAAEALLAQREAVVERTVRQLEILAGGYPRGEYAVATDLVALPPPVPVGLPSQLLLRRPDLISAERQIAAAGLRVESSRAAMLPSFGLSASAGMAGNHVERLVDPDFFIWNLVGNLLAPLFQGNRLRNTVYLNEARARSAAHAFARVALQAFVEVETALAVESRLADQLAALQVAAEEAEAARRLADDRYAKGLVPLITLLDAQRRELDSRSQLLAVRRARLDTRIDLHLALGGGMDELRPDVPPAAGKTETP
ncbi:MAG: efflux transporter outer membrane subunit [Planctomycetota bacterium]